LAFYKPDNVLPLIINSNSSFHRILHNSFSFTGPYIFHSIFLSNTANALSSPTVSVHDSEPQVTTGRTNVRYICSLLFLDMRLLLTTDTSLYICICVLLALLYCLVSQYFHCYSYQYFNLLCHISLHPVLNPLNAELNPICHLLALLGAHLILHVSRLRVNVVVAVPLTRILVFMC
jgi:hypothetical protein